METLIKLEMFINFGCSPLTCTVEHGNRQPHNDLNKSGFNIEDFADDLVVLLIGKFKFVPCH